MLYEHNDDSMDIDVEMDMEMEMAAEKDAEIQRFRCRMSDIRYQNKC
jgi:hypothetical protein